MQDFELSLATMYFSQINVDKFTHLLLVTINYKIKSARLILLSGQWK